MTAKVLDFLGVEEREFKNAEINEKTMAKTIRFRAEEKDKIFIGKYESEEEKKTAKK